MKAIASRTNLLKSSLSTSLRWNYRPYCLSNLRLAMSGFHTADRLKGKRSSFFSFRTVLFYFHDFTLIKLRI